MTNFIVVCHRDVCAQDDNIAHDPFGCLCTCTCHFCVFPMHHLEDLTLIIRHIMTVIDIDMFNVEFPVEIPGH